MSKLFSKNNNGSKSVAGSAFRRGLESPLLYLGIIVGLIFVLIIWAGVAEIDKVVRVEGKIIPAGRSQQIQHLEGGIIAAISTTEGASVKRGDLLLTIDDTTAGSNLSETEVKLNAQRVRAIRLEAEVKDKDTLVYPPDLAKLPAAEAERNLFITRKAKLNQELSVHQNVIKQRTVDIDDAADRLKRLTTELATAQQRMDMVQGMAARGAASKMEVLEAQSREQRLKSEIGEVEGAVPKAKAAIDEERARMESARAEFRTQAQNDLVTALAEADRLKQIITAAADRLKRTEIRAPIDGVINHISVNTVGGVVKPGENLIELIPNTSEVLIEAKAQPRDRGFLRSGLSAEIRVSAYDAGEYGLLHGKVTEVSADSMQDGRNDPYYQVNILVDALPPRYAGHAMVPGMTVTADIVTGHRTLLDYLLSPLRKFTYNMFRDPR